MEIIKAADVRPLLEDQKAIIVDARGGPDAFERFRSAHIENALFVNLETDLSVKSDNAALGGRHPLPAPETFGELLGNLGITPDSVVVVYDDKKGANAAARFWWMLKAAGHKKVYVVSGGIEALQKSGFQIAKGTAAKPASAQHYKFIDYQLPYVDADEVAEAAENPDFLVIDVRENYRFVGESEPIDLVAGHIPGAVNIPFAGNLDKDGNFLSSAELAEKYKSALGQRNPKHVIVHCGSGVTACHTLLALADAGLEGAALYVGSWSEWSRNDRPVATGN
ncbi:sulfurtransferase [Dyadobacter psychrophilus]|uniref:Thiosulfate/3-mercaptopyruvate sulfurtransferase n=1 Tax=Dyadobacter psychrophilus TaxID=651661 RepID=A0A1T5GC37_9BACT|nr:sulfurtransferase [Dyadobacter psychrophilus]SKC05956.1 thiosulfate/3-mercaptopyruvate sulfurtransferase [Dyadobacter psychrophilus]